MGRLNATLLMIVLLVISNHANATDTWQDVRKIVAIGDIHGDYEQMRAVLEMSGVIDSKGRWVAGQTHLVQAGDIPDRGPDTAKIIRFFVQLEKEAKRKQGFVHLLIGNHEAMNMTGDLRYVTPDEYAALVTRKSARLRDLYYERTIDWLKKNTLPEQQTEYNQAYREQWNKKYPLGYVEHRQIWDKDGEFGKWVRGHNSVIKINDILFVHGGIGPGYAEEGISELNKEVSESLAASSVAGSIVEATEGPLWYRGLAQNDEESEEANLELLLTKHAVNHIVIAHTVTEGAIKPRFNGKVIMIDAGMAAYYGSHKASLVIEDGNFSVVHRGRVMALPFAGQDLIDYLEAAMNLETNQTRLRKLIDELKHPAVTMDQPEQIP